MGKIKEMAARLRALTPKVMKEQTLKIAQAHEKEAVNMNTDQLFAGQLANGEDMPDYSPVSVQIYGKRPGPWQAYSSGDLYKQTFLDAEKFPILMGSKSRHTGIFADHLASKGGNPDEIFGLNKSNFTEFARVDVLPSLQEIIRKAIRVQ